MESSGPGNALRYDVIFRAIGSPALSILLENSRRGPFGRKLGKMGPTGKANPRSRTPLTNSPAVSQVRENQSLFRFQVSR
jgi:hypothetical protein